MVKKALQTGQVRFFQLNPRPERLNISIGNGFGFSPFSTGWVVTKTDNSTTAAHMKANFDSSADMLISSAGGHPKWICINIGAKDKTSNGTTTTKQTRDFHKRYAIQTMGLKSNKPKQRCLFEACVPHTTWAAPHLVSRCGVGRWVAVGEDVFSWPSCESWCSQFSGDFYTRTISLSEHSLGVSWLITWQRTPVLPSSRQNVNTSVAWCTWERCRKMLCLRLVLF